MTELKLLLEVLKFFSIFYGFYRVYKQNQKEKAMSEKVDALTHRLTKLENVVHQLDE